ncbi:MAG TPA: zf-HC2 domain-containing protein [Bryobacteraceae bacterium]|nr:zf-HC2 domain-containing protein [Bryobacteraceae bacterium]HPT27684.1 zf-HC2 domain-containing protein [Bryobacteraceae bacterium]
MDCQEVRTLISAMVDGCVVDGERRDALEHMKGCSDCAGQVRQIVEIRQSLKQASAKPLPPELILQLRVIASREAARRRTINGFAGRIKAWKAGPALWANNLMRPLAVPAMGGLASAVVLFSMVMTNFQGIVRAHQQDVPTVLYTVASVRSSLDLALGPEEIAVDVFVDEQGRVMDYAFPSGYGRYNTAAIRRGLENSLLFTQFHPATSFGQPTSGWVRVSFRRSEIQVKG